jgi:hypothetical protein
MLPNLDLVMIGRDRRWLSYSTPEDGQMPRPRNIDPLGKEEPEPVSQAELDDVAAMQRRFEEAGGIPAGVLVIHEGDPNAEPADTIREIPTAPGS